MTTPTQNPDSTPEAPTNRFTIEEAAITKQLGVARVIVVNRRLKELTFNVEWAKINGVIYYTEETAKKVLGWFLPSNVTAEIGALPQFEVRIVKTWPNPKIMEVEHVIAKPTGNPQFRVRVKDSTNFMPGMIALVKHYPGDNLPTVIGKLPRRKGQW